MNTEVRRHAWGPRIPPHRIARAVIALLGKLPMPTETALQWPPTPLCPWAAYPIEPRRY